MTPLTIEAENLRSRIEGDDAPLIVDVRSGWEYRLGHIPGARHVPFWKAPWQSSSLAREPRELVVLCGHGPRAWIVVAALRLTGRRAQLLRGHMSGWGRRGLPIER